MKLRIALLAFGCCTVAAAQIYKYVDPVTGAVEYTPQQRRKGDVPLSASLKDSKKTVDAEKARVAALRKRRADLASEINKKWAGACSQHVAGGWTCNPRVGMPIQRYLEVTELKKLGYSEDASGKIDRWGVGSCRVMAKDDTIVSVAC